MEQLYPKKKTSIVGFKKYRKKVFNFNVLQPQEHQIKLLQEYKKYKKDYKNEQKDLKQKVLKKKDSFKIKLKLKKGSLKGYSLKLKRTDRRKILLDLIKKVDPIIIRKRLNILYIFNKNKYPEKAEKYKRDYSYIKKISTKNSPSAFKSKK